jgi:hypothetical protein
MDTAPLAEMQFYDIYDVWYTPWYKTHYFYIFLATVFLLFSYLIYRWYKNRKVFIVKLSPSQKALLIIEKLKKESHENYSLCYMILTQTLKSYLEEESNIPLKGLTDEEFITLAQRQKFFSPEILQNLITILEGIIFIKFAGERAQNEHFKKALELAQAVINKVSSQERE